MSELQRPILLAFIWAAQMLLGILWLMVAFRSNKGRDTVLPLMDRIGCGISGVVLLFITLALMFGMNVLVNH